MHSHCDTSSSTTSSYHDSGSSVSSHPHSHSPASTNCQPASYYVANPTQQTSTTGFFGSGNKTSPKKADRKEKRDKKKPQYVSSTCPML